MTYQIHSFANTASAYKLRSTCIVPWLSPFCFMALKHGLPPSPIAAAEMCSTCAAKGASCVCSGSSTSATEASVNASSNQPHHLSCDNAGYAGSDTSYACSPPSRYEGSMTSTQTFIAGKDQEVAQRLDGLIPSSTTSILQASTTPMLPRWYMTDPSGRHFSDCQRSNSRKVLKSNRFQSEQCV